MEPNGHIAGLFQGLRARLAQHLTDRTALVRIIAEETKIQLKENEISLKKGILTLRMSPLKKNTLYIKKEAILKRIASETTMTVSEIR